MNSENEIYKKKFLSFAVKIVNLKNFLNKEKHEYNIADQIQRSGTSIGANHREAICAESRSDFIHKLTISQKECNETLYWLELLKETNYISSSQSDELYSEANELMRMLSASIMTLKNKSKRN